MYYSFQIISFSRIGRLEQHYKLEINKSGSYSMNISLSYRIFEDSDIHLGLDYESEKKLIYYLNVRP